VDQVGKERHAAARQEHHHLHRRRRAQDDQRARDRPDAFARSLDAVIDQAVRVSTPSATVVAVRVLAVPLPVVNAVAGVEDWLRGTQRQTEMTVPTDMLMAVHSRSVTVQQRVRA
jgi:predicted NBD/HSP70 family sugar kinase